MREARIDRMLSEIKRKNIIIQDKKKARKIGTNDGNEFEKKPPRKRRKKRKTEKVEKQRKGRKMPFGVGTHASYLHDLGHPSVVVNLTHFIY